MHSGRAALGMGGGSGGPLTNETRALACGPAGILHFPRRTAPPPKKMPSGRELHVPPPRPSPPGRGSRQPCQGTPRHAREPAPHRGRLLPDN